MLHNPAVFVTLVIVAVLVVGFAAARLADWLDK